MVVDCARDKNIPIRIGVNAGSLEKDLQEKYGEPTPQALLESAMRHVDHLDRLNFDQFKVSVKASDVFLAVESYRLLAKQIALDEDCKRRMYTNPLRVLDSKNPDVQALLNDAPALGDYLDDDSREHFAGLCKLLDAAGIAYTVNQRLVRGLDYYNRTVFEWVTNSLGSQGTVCAGGRYDGLVEQLGGRATPAVGFAMGLERLVLLVQAVNPEFIASPVVDIYLVAAGAQTQSAAMTLAERLRDEMPGVKLMTNHGGGNFKKQFARADKWGARIALVLGESEVADGTVVVKDLRSGEQTAVAQDSVAAHLRTLLG